MPSLDEKRLYAVIGANIKAARIHAGLSQDDLASKLGLLRTSVTNIEAGRQKASISAIYIICSNLDVKMIDILPALNDVIQNDAYEYLDASNLPIRAGTILDKYKSALNE